MLSHELRTPLTPALAAVGLIESTPALPADEVRRLVGMVRRNIETGTRLVDDLLDVTRIAQGKIELQPEAVDVHLVVRDTVAMVQGIVDEKLLEVAVALRARDHHVWADSGRLQQALLNLLSNAAKFTPAGGRVAIDTANRLGSDGCPQLVIRVTDTGMGIDPATMPRLFRAFEQGDWRSGQTRGGLGLGLSIVRSLVDLHGGRVSAASDGLGLGSTFTVELRPMDAAASTAPAPPAPPPVAGGGRSGVKVLLVEDHDDTRHVLQRLLAGFGRDVTTAATVAQAKQLADSVRFDLLVSDIGLPDGTGLDVMRHVRGKTRGIALSGFGQDEDHRRSREAGFDRHLTKPINFKVLRGVILQVAC